MSDWITINPTSGCNDDSVSFTASKNTTGAERSAKYRIYNDDYGIEKYVTVSQPAYVGPVTESTKIYYKTNDGNIMTPTTLSATDASGNSLTYTNTYISGQGVIKFNGVVKDINMNFKNCSTLKTFDGISNKVYLTADASYMFNGCNYLTTLDVSNFDTSNVTNMSYMFNDMYSLNALDVSNFDTSNVTDMSYMFKCVLLSTLNGLENWNTSKVTNMSYMFKSFDRIYSLDLSNWDTSSVTDMSYMFYYCTSLSHLGIGSNCIIGSSTNTYNMFYNLSSSGTLQYPTGMDSTQVEKWTPTGWTAVAY